MGCKLCQLLVNGRALNGWLNRHKHHVKQPQHANAKHIGTSGEIGNNQLLGAILRVGQHQLQLAQCPVVAGPAHGFLAVRAKLQQHGARRVGETTPRLHLEAKWQAVAIGIRRECTGQAWQASQLGARLANSRLDVFVDRRKHTGLIVRPAQRPG